MGLAAVVAAALFSALAAWNGIRFSDEWQQQVSAAQFEAAHHLERQQGEIAAGNTLVTLFSIRDAIILPPAPLTALATGRADLDPRTTTTTTNTRQHTLFRDYEIESPLALALGRFDLAFVIQTLLPLLIIALGYGIVAEERERGLDRILVVQQVSPRRNLSARLLARALLVVVPLLAVLIPLCGGFNAYTGWALGLILGYLAFWWALVAWVGTWKLREGQTLLVLLSAWGLLVLALPALSGLLARELHPPPSRFELIAAARAQEIDSLKQSQALLDEYTHDHPELDPAASADIPAWHRSYFLMARRVDAAVAPVVQSFDNALNAQQAAVERWQYTTPALIVQRGLTALAGTDEYRRAAFIQQARAHHLAFREQTGRMMLAGERLDAANFAALPRFSFSEPGLHTLNQRLRPPVLVLWALSGLGLGLAFWRVERSLSARSRS